MDKISILEFIKEQIEKLELCRDEESGEVYIVTENGLVGVYSDKIKNQIASKVFIQYKKPVSYDNYRFLLDMVISEKKSEIAKVTSYMRIGGEVTDKIFYDLGNSKNEIVEINKENWKVTINNKNFIRSTKMQEQPSPILCLDRNILEKHFSHCEKNTLVLLMVCIVGRFFPDIEHPIIYYYGSMGAAKSTTAKKEKLIVDPTTTLLKNFPKTVSDVSISLSKEYLSVFDNLSQINTDISNLLCQAVTGGTYTTRELYTNSGEIVLNLKSAISITGIEVCIEKPDLYDRAILVKLKRMEETDFKSSKEILKELDNDMPQILGYIFSIISKAMSLYDNIQPQKNSRLSSFYRVGCCIAEAMGYGYLAFEEAYSENRKFANAKSLSRNYVGELIIRYMEGKTKVELQPSKLYQILKNIALEEYNSDEFPSTVNVLGKKISEAEVNLKNEGIEVKRDKKGKDRRITLTNNNSRLDCSCDEISELI